MGREFWTTVEVVSVEWKDFCRTTATCADPRFEVSYLLVKSGDFQLVANLENFITFLNSFRKR